VSGGAALIFASSLIAFELIPFCDVDGSTLGVRFRLLGDGMDAGGAASRRGGEARTPFMVAMIEHAVKVSSPMTGNDSDGVA
jgi:hypothetical protein